MYRTALGSDSDDGGRTGVLCNNGPTECSGHGTCCHRFLTPNADSQDGWSVRFEPGGRCDDGDLGG